jgi:hypothetical protein
MHALDVDVLTPAPQQSMDVQDAEAANVDHEADHAPAQGRDPTRNPVT